MRACFSGKEAAFTLVELLVALTIIVALTLLALPAIGPMISVNSVDSAANTLRGALIYARNAAVARQTDGFCWLANGSVIESGVLNPVFGGSAEFVSTDATTQGDWKGTYGAGGYKIVNDSENLPCGTVSFTGGTDLTWEDPTADTRGLEKGGNTDHIAACRYSTASFTIDVDITDGLTHEMNLYLLGWGTDTREQNIVIRDAATDAVLDGPRPISGFMDGKWMTWNVSGHVKVVITKVAGSNCVISGVFFGEGTDGGGGGAPSTKSFAAPSKVWMANMWANNYYVVIANQVPNTDNVKTIFGKIQSNLGDTITVTESWTDEDGATSLVTGSRFLIHAGDPESPDGGQSVGSGTDAAASWNKLPEGVSISPTDAVVPNRRVSSVAFTRNGRAGFSNGDGYITFKVYSRDDPDNTDYWRFVRLYANTGRTAVARKLSDLP